MKRQNVKGEYDSYLKDKKLEIAYMVIFNRNIHIVLL